MFGRSDGGLQDFESGYRCRMSGPRGQDHPQYQCPRYPGRHCRLHRQARIAQTVQRRCQGGYFRSGMRSEHRELQRYSYRRHHRRIRTSGNKKIISVSQPQAAVDLQISASSQPLVFPKRLRLPTPLFPQITVASKPFYPSSSPFFLKMFFFPTFFSNFEER